MHTLPKTLTGFYFRRAFRPFAALMATWAILTFLLEIAYLLFMPFSQKAFIGLFEQTAPIGATFMEFAMPTMLAILIGWLTIDFVQIFSSMLGSRTRPRVENRISEILNEYLHRQSTTFWNDKMTGKVNQQINYVAQGASVVEEFVYIFGAAFAIIIGSAIMFEIHWKVACVIAAVFVFRFVYGIALVRPMNRASKTSSDSRSSLSGKIVDSLSNHSIVRMFAAAKDEENHIQPTRKKSIFDRIYASFMQRWFWGLPMFVWDFMFFAIMVICAGLFISGEMKVSEIVFTMSAYFSISGAINHIVRQIPMIVDTIGSAQKSYEELVKPIDILDAPNAPDLKVSRGKIDIKNVNFSFGRRKVLENFSLTIQPGEKVGLVGHSGAGKTTLVNMLMRFYDPKKGAIFVDGQDIKNVRQDSLRKHISFIPQEPTMFNRTLRENIGYGKPGAAEREIKAAAKRASADKFINDTPKKYESLVGDRGIKLSGGQRQRIAIARAFLKDAPILILDEATSALDSETESIIQKSFTELSKGRTTITIARRLSTLRHMDRIIVMDKGKIVESGTHSVLLRKNGIYARLWKMQSGGFISE